VGCTFAGSLKEVTNMLVPLDSPLRRLPIGLDRQQTLFIDGLRISAEILDLAYSRLIQTLFRLAEPDCTKEERAIGIISAVGDAWSIVDSTHRIRRLLRRMPRVKKKGPALQVFFRATFDADALRHVIQHLDEKVTGILALGAPVWGTLQWLVLLDRKTFLMRTSTIAPGTAFDAEHPVQNPAGKTMRATVDHVILTANGVSIDLSDVFYEVKKMVGRMESTLANRFSNLPAYGADLLTTLEMQLLLDPESVAGSPETPAT